MEAQPRHSSRGDIWKIGVGRHPSVLFLLAALAEAGLEIAFKVGWSVGPKVLAGEVSDICPPPPPNLAGEVETLVHSPAKLWRGR